MTKLKLILYSLAVAMLLPFTACEDEDLNPVLAPETAVHGLAELQTGSAANFNFGDNNSTINAQLQWISIDQLNTVTKIELFVEWLEAYKDDEGNPQTANHGTKKIKVIEGGAVPANRTNVAFSVSAKDLFELFKDATFDYGDGNGSVSVFNNTFKPDRSANAYFTSDDAFTLTWAFTTADGRYFDSWSDSVCSEFPGANCDIKWGVICTSDLGGTFDYVQTDMFCPGTVSGTVTWTETTEGVYVSTDYVFGSYAPCYNAGPVSSDKAGVTLKILDACNRISLSGADNYGDTYTYTIQKTEGTALTLKWENTYGEFGTVVLTRQDGKNWPALRN